MLSPDEMKVQRVYMCFRKAAGGADGGVVGVNGSLSVMSLFCILQIMGIKGRRLVDMGGGEGRVLISAMACGADCAFGYELPDNMAHKFVFDAALTQMARHCPDQSVLLHNAQWFAGDIDQVVGC